MFCKTFTSKKLNSRFMKKKSFGQRLFRFVKWSAFGVTVVAVIFCAIAYRGYQVNEAKKAATLQTAPGDSLALKPAAFTALEEPKMISTPTAGRTTRKAAPAPATYSAKQPTKAEQDAARAAWIAKRDSIEAVRIWKEKQAAKTAKAAPAGKQASKGRGEKVTATVTKKTAKENPRIVAAVKPPTAKEIEAQKLWILMKQETADIMGGRKDPTPAAKAKPVQSVKILELMAGKWTDFK